jgi:YVTN family beta-propeller protein
MYFLSFSLNYRLFSVKFGKRPDGIKVYVTTNIVNNEYGNVSVIDTATNNVTATVNVGKGP